MDLTSLRIPAQPAPRDPAPVDRGPLLAEILRDELVVPVFQPIVDLTSRDVVAFEALARGPATGPLAALSAPGALFAAARRAGRLAELDWLCRITALEAAAAAGVCDPLTLFVNVEPEVAGAAASDSVARRLAAVAPRLRVVVEFTERSLTASPASLLATAEFVRALGWGIAVDDVGADPHSLALMPFLRPDVVKLDLRLVQSRPDLEIAQIMTAVSAYAERTGCDVLAEGIETAEHVELARALGARLGQGWHLGRPAPLPDATRTAGIRRAVPRRVGRVERIDLHTAGTRSLYEIAAQERPSLRSTKPLLIEVSKLLERQALAIGGTAVVLGAFEDAEHFTPATRRRYDALGRATAFVGALGAGLGPEPAERVRGGHLSPADPVIGEWHVAVVSPHFSAALVARDLQDEGPDLERRFDYVLTYDQDLVSRVAVGLMARLLPQAPLPDHVAADERVDAASVPAAAGGVQQASVEELLPVLLRGLDLASSGVTVADASVPGMPLVWVNAGFERLTGYRSEQIVGRNCRFLQGPGTDPHAVARIATALRRQEPACVTLLNYRADGTPFWCRLELTPVTGLDGRTTHVIGVQTEVTASEGRPGDQPAAGTLPSRPAS